MGKKQLQQWGVNPTVVIVGNMILFAVSITSLLLYQRAMAHPTTMGFLRNTYSGLFLKLLVCIIAIMIYVVLDREHVNKPAIFTCVFLYFLYTLLEIRSLMQWNKARRNA
jgi:cobalamin biosynthesis protein CobD/CbiB